MKYFMQIFYATVVVCSLFALGGCGTIMLPQNFTNAAVAFSTDELSNPPKHIPSDAIKKSSFPVSYEDVYRAALVSASQAQFNVEEENKAEGKIFLTRSIRIPPPGYWDTFESRKPQPRWYYYVILVKEKGPRLTEIIAMAKAQGRCYYTAVPLDREKCKKYSTLHWATGDESSLVELNQFIVFIRNNLIAAGLI